MAASNVDVTEDVEKTFSKIQINEENIETELRRIFKSPKNSNEIGNAVSKLHSDVEENGEDIFSRLANLCSFSQKIAENVPAAESVATTLRTITTIFQFVGDQMRVNAQKIEGDETYAPFERFQDSEITSEACGLEDLFYTTHAYLNGISDQANDEEMIKTLQDKVPIFKGVEFLGKIKANIESLVTKPDIKSVSRAVAYIDLYSRLAILRTLILWQLYAIKKLSNVDKASTNGVYAVIKETDKTDREMLENITKSSFDKIVFLTIFNPTELRHFQYFLSVKSINPFRLDKDDAFCSKMHLIHSAKWPEWHMKFGWDRQGSIWGEKNWEKSACKFMFEPADEREIDNIFHIRSVKYPNYYMIMESGKLGYCGSVEGLPGPEGKWKIIRFIEDKLPSFVMSPLSRPCYFIYMTSSPTGHVRGAYDLREIRIKGIWKVIDVDSKK